MTSAAGLPGSDSAAAFAIAQPRNVGRSTDSESESNTARRRSTGVVAPFDGRHEPRPTGLVAALEVGPDELVLAAERAVQAGLGDAGALDDLVDADGVDALLVEQLVGGGEETVARRAVLGQLRAHGVDVTRQICLVSTVDQTDLSVQCAGDPMSAITASFPTDHQPPGVVTPGELLARHRRPGPPAGGQQLPDPALPHVRTPVPLRLGDGDAAVRRVRARADPVDAHAGPDHRSHRPASRARRRRVADPRQLGGVRGRPERRLVVRRRDHLRHRRRSRHVGVDGRDPRAAPAPASRQRRPRRDGRRRGRAHARPARERRAGDRDAVADRRAVRPRHRAGRRARGGPAPHPGDPSRRPCDGGATARPARPSRDPSSLAGRVARRARRRG